MNIRYHFAGLCRWLRLLRQHGRPNHLFYFNGGIGDQLLCSAVAHEIQRQHRRNIWLFTQVPELFTGNFDFRVTLPLDLGLVPWAKLSGTRVQQMYYQDYVHDEGRDAPINEPIIAALCRRAGLLGEITLRPYLPAVPLKQLTSRKRPRIAIHSSCLNARYPIANKQWPIEHLQAVANSLASHADLVQFGSAQDPRLNGTKDRRGGTLLDAAHELADCNLFVGLVGFFMHLARAVECPAVIVYGGREPPEITGYSCNINLASQMPCAPCWYYSQCAYDPKCLTEITPEVVVDAVQQFLAAPVIRPLSTTRFKITR